MSLIEEEQMYADDNTKQIYGEIQLLKDYIQKYGNISLNQLIETVDNGRKHACPACETVGQICKITYPHYRKIVRWFNCTNCQSFGYTVKPLKPIMKQVGWE